MVNVIVLPMAFLVWLVRADPALPGAFSAPSATCFPLKYLLDAINAIYLHGQQLWHEPTASPCSPPGASSEWLVALRNLPLGATRGLGSRPDRSYDLRWQVEQTHRLRRRRDARRAGDPHQLRRLRRPRRDDRRARGARPAAAAGGGRGLDRRRGTARSRRGRRGRRTPGARRDSAGERARRPGERKEFSRRLVTLAEIWARQCIHERRAEITELSAFASVRAHPSASPASRAGASPLRSRRPVR